MATQLDQQPRYDEPQLRRHLEPQLRRMQGGATLGDIVTATGLPAEQTEPMLRQMLDEYNGRLRVDENGELIYDFPRGLNRESNLGDVWRQAVATLWSWFKLAYKVGYSVILVLYFVVFLIIMIAIMVAMLAAAANSDSDIDLDFDLDGCGGCFFFPDLLWFAGPDIDRRSRRSFTPARPTTYRTKPQSQKKMSGKRFWQQVFEFVFGEEKPEADPLADERALLSYIRDGKGRITAAEIAALRGISLDEAEQVALHLMVAHRGDVEVSDDGSLIYTFDRLMVSADAGRSQSRSWTWWWERKESPEPLNRNSEGANWGIGFLNLFNLLWSGFITWSGPGMMPDLQWVWVLLGPFPFLFSSLFFLIPMVRWWLLQGENEERRRRNALREVAYRLFRHHIGGDLDPVHAENLMRASGEGETLPLARLRELLERLAKWWQAEPESDESGRVGWRFARLRQELHDVGSARQAVEPEQFRLGGIAYDTEAGE